MLDSQADVAFGETSPLLLTVIYVILPVPYCCAGITVSTVGRYPAGKLNAEVPAVPPEILPRR